MRTGALLRLPWQRLVMTAVMLVGLVMQLIVVWVAYELVDLCIQLMEVWAELARKHLGIMMS